MGLKALCLKKLLITGIATGIVLGSASVVGATSLREAENNLTAAQSQISSIESQQAELQEQIDALDAELVDAIICLDTTGNDIESKKEELAKAREDLVEAEEKEAEQYESMKKRIAYMYSNNGSSLLTALLGSDSFADVINKIELYSAVYKSDRELLEEYEAVSQEVRNLVAEIEEEEAQLEEIQVTYEEQVEELEAMKSEKSAELDDYDDKLEEAESLAAQYETTIMQYNQTMAEGLIMDSSSFNDDTSNSNSTGSAVAEYACQFIGNPYKYGGTSLTSGCDCSGFVMSVYAHFGISLPHSSSSMRSVGYAVSVSEIQPGDIVCYSGHVGIYVGNGKIVNASNSKPYPAGGIKYTNLNYRSILAVRRVF